MSRLLAQKYRLAGMALLLVFASYWCGITLFTHSHVVNGVIVVHSHPFKAGHTHTDTQLETIFFAADFRRNEHQCGLALLAYSFGTDSLCLHDGSTLSSVRGHPDTRSSLSLIFSGHILPVYES